MVKVYHFRAALTSIRSNFTRICTKVDFIAKSLKNLYESEKKCGIICSASPKVCVFEAPDAAEIEIRKAECYTAMYDYVVFCGEKE